MTSRVFVCGGESKNLSFFGSGKNVGALDLVRGVPGGHNGTIYDVLNVKNQFLASCSSKINLHRFSSLDSLHCVLEGHTKQINRLKYFEANDKIYLASTSEDKSAKIWNLESERCVWDISTHDAGVRDLIYLPDNNQICTVTSQGKLSFFDHQKQEQIDVIDSFANNVRHFLHDARNGLLYTISFDGVLIWQINGMECVGLFGGNKKNKIMCLAKTPGSSLMVTGDQAGNLETWDLRNLKTGTVVSTLKAHSDVVWQIKSIDNDVVVSCSSDKTVKTSDILKQEITGVVKFEYPVHCVEFIGDALTNAKTETDSREDGEDVSNVSTHRFIGKVKEPGEIDMLVFGGDKKYLSVVDLENRKLLKNLKNSHQSRIWDVVDIGNGQFCSCSQDTWIKIWSSRDFTEVFPFVGHADVVFGLDYLRDSSGPGIISSCSKDDSIKIWDLKKFRCLWSIQAHSNCVRDVEFLQQKKWIASASWDRSVGVFVPERQTRIASLIGHSDWVRVVCTDERNDLIFSAGSDNVINFWNITQWKSVEKIVESEESHSVYSMVSFPTKHLLVCGDESGQIVMWDIRKTNQCVKSFQAHADVIWRLKRTREVDEFVSCSSDMSIKHWKLGEEEPINHIKCGFKVFGVEFMSSQPGKSQLNNVKTKKWKTPKEIQSVEKAKKDDVLNLKNVASDFDGTLDLFNVTKSWIEEEDEKKHVKYTPRNLFNVVKDWVEEVDELENGENFNDEEEEVKLERVPTLAEVVRNVDENREASSSVEHETDNDEKLDAILEKFQETTKDDDEEETKVIVEEEDETENEEELFAIPNLRNSFRLFSLTEVEQSATANAGALDSARSVTTQDSDILVPTSRRVESLDTSPVSTPRSNAQINFDDESDEQLSNLLLVGEKLKESTPQRSSEQEIKSTEVESTEASPESFKDKIEQGGYLFGDSEIISTKVESKQVSPITPSQSNELALTFDDEENNELDSFLSQDFEEAPASSSTTQSRAQTNSSETSHSTGVMGAWENWMLVKEYVETKMGIIKSASPPKKLKKTESSISWINLDDDNGTESADITPMGTPRALRDHDMSYFDKKIERIQSSYVLKNERSIPRVSSSPLGTLRALRDHDMSYFDKKIERIQSSYVLKNERSIPRVSSSPLVRKIPAKAKKKRQFSPVGVMSKHRKNFVPLVQPKRNLFFLPKSGSVSNVARRKGKGQLVTKISKIKPKNYLIHRKTRARKRSSFNQKDLVKRKSSMQKEVLLGKINFKRSSSADKARWKRTKARSNQMKRLEENNTPPSEAKGSTELMNRYIKRKKNDV